METASKYDHVFSDNAPYQIINVRKNFQLF